MTMQTEFQLPVTLIAADAASEPSRIHLGRLLVERGLITTQQLDHGLQVQAQTGEKLGRVVVSLGYVNRLALSQVLAQQADLPHLNLREDSPSVEVARLLPLAVARRLRAVPVRWLNNHLFLLVALADPWDTPAQDELRAQLGVPLTFAVASELDVERALEHSYRASFVAESVSGLLYRNPEESARETFTDGQVLAVFGLCLMLILGLSIAPEMTLVAINLLVSIIYLASLGYRLWLSHRGGYYTQQHRHSEEDLRGLDDFALPVITILTPAYHEQEVLPGLIESLEELDYPKTKLDVKLLLEEDDHESIQAVLLLKPPPYIKLVIVPNSQPRTKPKACNYGLLTAEGQLLVIFDAEDRPDRDQLRRVVAAFRKAAPEVVCIQAKLNYYNRTQNLLTRWFTAEYSNWFDQMLPGLAGTGAPIPLGGTSNYFYTERLRELGAWDPFNVTEDADLGIRMAKRGYRTAIVDSTTYEEATSQVGNWIRQRSRWFKGYMQTWLVHTRAPLGLLRSLGPRSFLSFNLTVGGTPLIALFNPIWWLLTIFWLGGYLRYIQFLFPGPVYYMALFNLLVGNFLCVYLNLLGSAERSYSDLGRSALLSMGYWVLMSVAAWKGLWQLLTKPFYWEKTNHGLLAAHPAMAGPVSVARPNLQSAPAALHPPTVADQGIGD